MVRRNKNNVFRKNGKKAKKQERKMSEGSLTTSKVSQGQLSQVVEPWMPLFPARTVKMLRYSTSFNISTTAGAVGTYVFRANDLFDPDFSGTGHQPMGFDQMMLFYNHFCVTHAKMIVTARNLSTTGSPTSFIRQDAGSTTLTVADRILEFGGLVSCVLEPAVQFGQCKTNVLSLSVARLQGVTESALTADSTLRGDSATSPTEVVYFHVGQYDVNAINTSVVYEIILEQRAVFMEPRDTIESLAKMQESKTSSCRTMR
jgi:hypothetical protein